MKWLKNALYLEPHQRLMVNSGSKPNPLSKVHGNPFGSFCVIMMTNQPTKKQHKQNPLLLCEYQELVISAVGSANSCHVPSNYCIRNGHDDVIYLPQIMKWCFYLLIWWMLQPCDLLQCVCSMYIYTYLLQTRILLFCPPAKLFSTLSHSALRDIQTLGKALFSWFVIVFFLNIQSQHFSYSFLYQNVYNMCILACRTMLAVGLHVSPSEWLGLGEWRECGLVYHELGFWIHYNHRIIHIHSSIVLISYVIKSSTTMIWHHVLFILLRGDLSYRY